MIVEGVTLAQTLPVRPHTPGHPPVGRTPLANRQNVTIKKWGHPAFCPRSWVTPHSVLEVPPAMPKRSRHPPFVPAKWPRPKRSSFDNEDEHTAALEEHQQHMRERRKALERIRQQGRDRSGRDQTGRARHSRDREKQQRSAAKAELTARRAAAHARALEAQAAERAPALAPDLALAAALAPDPTPTPELAPDLPPTLPTLNVVTVFNLYFNGTTWDAALMLDAGSAAWRPTGRFRTWLQSHRFEWTKALHKKHGLNRFVRGLRDEVRPCHVMCVSVSLHP